MNVSAKVDLIFLATTRKQVDANPKKAETRYFFNI